MLRFGKYVTNGIAGAVSDHVSANDWVSLAQSNSIVWTLMAVGAIAVYRGVKNNRVVRIFF